MAGKNILVVDDDSGLRRIMRIQLEEAGFRVSLVANGDEALRMVAELQPALTITDLNMPVTGLTPLQGLKETESQTTVIVMTAFGTVESAVAP